VTANREPATALDQFDWQGHPRRLNLGCGWDRREGYLNVDLHDFHEPDLVADVRNCHMLPSGEYDEILAMDVLEHLPRADVGAALAEWARLLRVGGKLVLRLPDLVGLLRQFESSSDPAHHALLVQCLYGTQAYDGDWHRNGFTELLLRQALFDAGFDVTSIAHRDEWLFDVVATRTDTPAPVSVDDLVMSRPSPPPQPAVRGSDAQGAIARLATARVTTPVQPASSRVPGGRLVHGVVARLVSRHLTGLATQVNVALDAATDAVRAVDDADRRG
jgi:SAM-dependent methyltransferase